MTSSDPSTSYTEVIQRTTEVIQRTSVSRPTVKVPTNREENRLLKAGHVEDNNEDIAYLNLRIIYPALIFATISVVAFIVALLVSLYTDYIPPPRVLKKGFVSKYGSSLFHCNSSIPIGNTDLPSVLHLFEMNVTGNVLFRICVCIPMIIRIFNAIVWRKVLVMEYGDNLNILYKAGNDLVPMMTVVEVAALSLFSIINVHMDFPHVNRLCKVLFAISSTTNIFITTVVTFSFGKTSKKKIESLSILLKCITCPVYCYIAPQFFQQHLGNFIYPLCHSYVPRTLAIMEYVMILCYGIFQLSTLIDIRDVTFICYPRSCSGECEPVDPKNFEKGAKYEHCRAFEFNQRRIMNL